MSDPDKRQLLKATVYCIDLWVHTEALVVHVRSSIHCLPLDVHCHLASLDVHKPPVHSDFYVA